MTGDWASSGKSRGCAATVALSGLLRLILVFVVAAVFVAMSAWTNASAKPSRSAVSTSTAVLIASAYSYDGLGQLPSATPSGADRDADNRVEQSRHAVNWPEVSSTAPARVVAADTVPDVVNAAGKSYPDVIDPRTGDPIAAPSSGLSKVPVGDRVPWGAQQRGAYIKDWYDQGYSTPEGGWAQYDMHHIIPREYGGTNDFNNLVPVLRTVHQQEFNPWWMNYGG